MLPVKLFNIKLPACTAVQCTQQHVRQAMKTVSHHAYQCDWDTPLSCCLWSMIHMIPVLKCWTWSLVLNIYLSVHVHVIYNVISKLLFQNSHLHLVMMQNSIFKILVGTYIRENFKQVMEVWKVMEFKWRPWKVMEKQYTFWKQKCEKIKNWKNHRQVRNWL